LWLPGEVSQPVFALGPYSYQALRDYQSHATNQTPRTLSTKNAFSGVAEAVAWPGSRPCTDAANNQNKPTIAEPSLIASAARTFSHQCGSRLSGPYRSGAVQTLAKLNEFPPYHYDRSRQHLLNGS